MKNAARRGGGGGNGMKVETMQATARRQDKRRAMARRADVLRKAAEDRERVRRIVEQMKMNFEAQGERIRLTYPQGAPKAI